MCEKLFRFLNVFVFKQSVVMHEMHSIWISSIDHPLLLSHKNTCPLTFHLQSKVTKDVSPFLVVTNAMTTTLHWCLITWATFIHSFAKGEKSYVEFRIFMCVYSSFWTFPLPKKIVVEIFFQFNSFAVKVVSIRFECVKICQTKERNPRMDSYKCEYSSTQRQRRRQYVIIRMRIAAWIMSHTQTLRTYFPSVSFTLTPNFIVHSQLSIFEPSTAQICLCMYAVETRNLRASDRVKVCVCVCAVEWFDGIQTPFILHSLICVSSYKINI